MSLGKMLTESAAKHAERVAVVHGDRRINYRDLERAACALANHLRSAGLGREDKVAIMLPNCPEFIIAYFGIQKIGGVAVTLNVQSTPYELRHLLGNSDAKCLITQGSLAKRFEEIRAELPLCRSLITTNGLDEASPFLDDHHEGPLHDGDSGAGRRRPGRHDLHRRAHGQASRSRPDPQEPPDPVPAPPDGLPPEYGGHRACRHPLLPLLRGRRQHAGAAPDRRAGWC